jgi:transposase
MEPENRQGALGPNQRWSARRKRDVVLRLLRGEALDAVSREVGVEIYRLEAWRDQALTAMEGGLKQRDSDPLAEELKAAKLHIGELTMEVEILRKEKEIILRRPLAGRKSRK